MTRRNFLCAGMASMAAASAASRLAAADPSPIMPLGYNTYCLRSLAWNDEQLLKFADDHKLDAIFLQDSIDPGTKDPKHWREVKARAADHKLHLETGGAAVLPKTPDEFPAKVAELQMNIKRAAAMGSPLVRSIIASDRASLPPGPVEQHIETMVRLLKAVRSEVLDAGVKIAIETHKDLQSREFKILLDEVGTDFVGIYLDTGNPIFVLEHPLAFVETLGPYALTLHLRDSIIYEHPRGVAVHWVPLGEGIVDFKQIMETARRVCPNVYVYAKPITGRPAEVIPYLEPDYWKPYPDARAKDLARFLKLAKSGLPYDKPIVNEDLYRRKTPDYLLPAIQHQQIEHMERSIEYARKTLNLGRRWRES